MSDGRSKSRAKQISSKKQLNSIDEAEIFDLKVQVFLTAKEVEYEDPDRPGYDGEPTVMEMERYIKKKTKGLKGWYCWIVLASLEDSAALLEWQYRDLLIRQQYLQLKSKWWYLAHPHSRFTFILETFYVFYFPIFFIRILSSATYLGFLTSQLQQIPIDIFNYGLILCSFLIGVYDGDSKTVSFNPKDIAMAYIMSYGFWVDVLSSPPIGAFTPSITIYYLNVLFTIKILRMQNYLDFLQKGFVRLGYNVKPLELYGFFYIISLMYMFIPYTADIIIVRLEYEDSTYERWFLLILETIEVVFNLTYVDAKVLPGPWAWYTVARKWYIFLVSPLVSGAFLLTFSYMSHATVTYISVMDDVKAFIMRMALPKPLTKEMRHYYWLRYKGAIMDRRRLLALIPEYKQAAFFKTTYRMMMRVPLFNEIPHECYIELRRKSRKDFVLPGYDITVAGLYGRRMFVVLSGSFTLYSENGTKLVEIFDGGHVGELQLILDAPYLVTARCNEMSLVLIIERLLFYELIASDPVLSSTVSQNVLRRHQRMVDLLDAILEEDNTFEDDQTPR